MLRTALRRLHYLWKPIWLRYPDNIQFDTHNFCNLDCIHCNVQHSYNLPRGKMPLTTIAAVLNQYRGRLLWSVAPFMNGEPMLDKRLPEICTLAQKTTKTQCIIDTNGTVYENREMLIHPNLKLVRFTISALTPETYERVHGEDLIRQAIQTFNWFRKNKLPSQQPWLHFITNKENEHEMEDYIRHFRGIGMTIYPVHRNPQFQKNSEASKGSLEYGFMVDPQGNRRSLKDYSKFVPCPCWNIMGISWDGRILQCCDYPYEYNYGKVGEVDLDQAWQERNKNKMDNVCCHDCSIKFSHWKTLLDKWIK